MWSDAFRCVVHILYHTFYAIGMDSYLLLTTLSTYQLCVSYFYQELIRHLTNLKSYTITINYGGKVIGPQTWLKLSKSLIDNDTDSANVYVMDPEGPLSFENSDKNVVNPELILNRDIEIIRQLVRERFDSLAPSTQMRIDTENKIKSWTHLASSVLE